MKIFPSAIAMRGSFKRQIILAFVVGFFFLITIFSVYLVTREKGHLYHDSVEETTGLAESLAVSSLSWVLANDVAGLQEVVGSFQDYPALRYAMVISPTGRVLAHNDATKIGQFISDEKSLALLMSHPRTQKIMDNEYIVDVAVPISINNRHVGWARRALGRANISDALQRMMLVSGFFVLLSTALSLLAAIIIASRLGRRIGSLVKVAEEVQVGNFSTRASILGGEDEVTKLADTFNHMLDTLSRNEKELRSAGLYTRSLIEASLDMLATINAEGKITDVNQATVDFAGRSRSELIGTDFFDYFTEPDKACEGYQQVFAKGFITDYPLAIRHRDGHVTDVLFNASVYRDEAGEVSGVFAAARDVTERNKAEQEVTQLSLRNRQILDSAGEGIYGLDIEGRCTFVNPAALQLLGFSAEELLGQHSHSVFHHTKPDGHPYPENECPVQAAYKQGKVHRGDDLYWRKDGQNFPVEFISTPILESGTITGAVVAFRDITERKQAEEALRRLTFLQRTILDNVAYGVISTNPDGLVTSFNPAAERLLGYTANEVVGQQTPACWHDSEEVARNALQLSEELGTPITAGFEVFAARPRRNLPEENEWTFICKNGRRIPVSLSVTALRDESGQVTGFVGLAFDLTERKQAEEAIELNAQRVQALLQLNQMVVTTLKEITDFTLQEAVRLTQSKIGYLAFLNEDESVLTMNSWSKFAMAECAIDEKPIDYPVVSTGLWGEAVRQRQPVITNDYTAANPLKKGYPEGHVHIMRHMNVPVFDGDRIVIVAGVGNKDEDYNQGDVQQLTLLMEGMWRLLEHKRAEEELRRYKDHLEEVVQQRTADLALALDAAEAANRAKSVFLSSMSHELRTPMNAILGFSGMMRKDPQLSQEQRDNLDIINRSGDHLLTLINDVLDMAKIEAGRVQLDSAPIDLGVLLRDVTDMMQMRAQEKGLELLIDQSSEFPRYIKGDEMRLRQVLINLIGNAVKFTEHGSITLRLGVKLYDGVRHLLIKVEDTGIGIKPEDQLKIFKPFVQLDKMATQTGSGLGLALTQQYVQLMGGTVSAESTFGKGSIFQVKLPLEEISAVDVVAKLGSMENRDVVSLAPNQPEYRILIVEDQLDNQLLLTKLMKNVGFQVKVADDGKQAVELFQSWRPHLIWMDRRMPVMDGLEATRRIRELPGGKEVKIVAVTASVIMEQRDETVHAGMDEFVRKPYRFNEIYECMARQLGVQYIYADVHETEEVSDVVLTAEMLAALPSDLRRKLHDALESLENERIAAVMQQVASYDPILHKTLSHMVENFNYPAILKALQTSQAGSVT